MTGDTANHADLEEPGPKVQPTTSPTSPPTEPGPGAAAPGAEAAPGEPDATAGGRRHHALERGLEGVPVSPLRQGKFGRLFQDLPPLILPREQVDQIVDAMREHVVDSQPEGGGWGSTFTPSLDNGVIPSGYTYLGQFIDHDVTFDPASSLDRQGDPDALHNFRTPRLDLDSLYGAGPQDQPYLYEEDDERLLAAPNKLGEPDLPRNDRGRALTGDPRNDENMIVSQLHLLLIRAHNRLIGELRSGKYQDALRSIRPEDRFREAQRLLRWHYQYIVATDFLWRTCGGIVQILLHNQTNAADGRPTWDGALRLGPPASGGSLRYTPHHTPYMPVEFSGAAYRFGHSQPRPGYQFNDTISAQLFVNDPQGPGDTRHLGGFRPLLKGWTIQWDRFFDLGTGQQVQMSRLIDRRITEPLFFLGQRPQNVTDGELRKRQLPWRNIMRGIALGLPAGEDVALNLGVQPVVMPELQQLGISRTPLWYYVLAEAQEQQGGARLGDVGARIVVEVLLGLLQRDRFSFLRAEPAWKPFLGRDGSSARYEMADLVRYATGSTASATSAAEE